MVSPSFSGYLIIAANNKLFVCITKANACVISPRYGGWIWLNPFDVMAIEALYQTIAP